jgi:hypothetical protein
MGYYDNDPQPSETESSTELPADSVEGAESQADDEKL